MTLPTLVHLSTSAWMCEVNSSGHPNDPITFSSRLATERQISKERTSTKSGAMSLVGDPLTENFMGERCRLIQYLVLLF